jgi:hypothetical protein
MILRSTLLVLLLGFLPAAASAAVSKPADPRTLDQAIRANRAVSRGPGDSRFRDAGRSVARPFVETDPVRYVLINASTAFGSGPVREGLLRELPPDVTVVVYAASRLLLDDYRQAWKSLRSPDRLKFLYLNASGEGFWARDALPIPVEIDSPQGRQPGLVDARYYHEFEPDEELARDLRLPLIRHAYHFEGGNFQADADGRCFVVQAGTATAIPDSAFQTYYGCRQTVRLPRSGGIGHVDERLRLIGPRVALTDDPGYRSTLEKLGYRAGMLPRLSGTRTYANALIANGTAFVPVYGLPTDAEAIHAYEREGLRVVSLNSAQLSDEGKGSIHCMTMGYPAGTLEPVPGRPGEVRFAGAAGQP